MSTLLCVPITVRDAQSALALAQAAKAAGADLVEYRLDELFEGSMEAPAGGPHPAAPAIDRLIAESPLPCIATCRSASEGGGYDGGEAERAALYERLAGAAPGKAPAYLDLELASYSKSTELRRRMDAAVRPRESGPSLILSTHDFQGRPQDLTRRVLAMQAEPSAAVAKVAFKARSLRDNLELFELLSHRSKPMIALAMGEFGLMSRVLAPKFGGFLTFAALRPAEATAPGQPTVRDLLELYRFRSIKPTTAVYGVVGWPVAHSKSPLVHNAAFEAAGHDGVYLPLPIPTPEGGSAEDAYLVFKAALLELVHDERLTFRGASVTIPHKEHLLRLARAEGWSVDPGASAVGAANTLVVHRDAAGRFSSAAVMNSDAAGILEPLREKIPHLAGLPVAVIGAGGAGRAAAYALAHEGAAVTIHNRDQARARDLADALAPSVRRVPEHASLEELATSEAAVFINCTPLGMAGGPDPNASPLPPAALRARGNPAALPLVFDTVYNPVETPLLRQARAAGAPTVDGVRMFVRQACVQSNAWTGRWPDAAMFDRLVRESLA